MRGMLDGPVQRFDDDPLFAADPDCTLQVRGRQRVDAAQYDRPAVVPPLENLISGHPIVDNELGAAVMVGLSPSIVRKSRT